MKQKKILFINCGWEQLPTVELLFKKKYQIYSICFNKKLIHKKFFKEVLYCKFEEINKIYKFVNKIKPNGVISDQCDFSYLIHAKISKKFNLLGPTENKAKIFTNKLSQRKIISKSKLKYPNFFAAKKFSEINKNLNILKSDKVVIKPLDNRGGFGVVIKNKNKINKTDFLNCIKYSKCKTIILEEFIDGVHYNLDGLLWNKKPKLIGVSINKKMKNEIVNKSLSYQQNLLKQKKFKIYFKSLCRVFKPTFGLLHAEIIINKGEIYLTEMANRGGGIRISNTVLNYTSGYNINEFLIQSALYKKFKLIRFKSTFKDVFIKFLQIRNKKIGIKKVLNKNVLYYKKLSNAKKITNSSKRNFIVIANGTNIKNAERKINNFFRK